MHIELISSKELDSNDYTLEYHIPNVLVKGQPCILAGAKKSGKTSIAIDLAISLAIGGSFLGCLPVKRPCNVVMLSGESGLATIKETAQRISQSKGIPLAGIDKLNWSTFVPMFDNTVHMDAVERMIDEVQCEALLIDPVYLCMSGADAGNLFVQGRILQKVNDVCQRHGVTLLLIHHTRKQGKTRNRSDHAPPELDDIAWAGFSEFARQWLLIGRREDYRPGSGQHELWLNIGGSAGHSALWAVDVNEGLSGEPRYWEVDLSSPSEARAEKNSETARQRILNVMREFPNGQTKTPLLKAAKVRSNETAQEILDALVTDGQLAQCKVKKGSGTYPGYVLAV